MKTMWSSLRSRLTRRRRVGDAAETYTEEWSELTERARSDMDARRAALVPLAGVVSAMSAALLEEDPIALGTTSDSDEYDSEAESIVMRLSDQSHLASEEELLQIIHEEFVRWFGSDLAGDTERYLGSAARLHRLWGDYLASGS